MFHQERHFLLVTLFCLSWFVLSAHDAHGSYLTISGQSNLTFGVEEGNVHISGSYQIENKGDETAADVFPSFQLGEWSWAGAPKSLDPNKQENWKIDEKFSLEMLHCDRDPACAGQSLPLQGVFPLFVRRHYADLNSYQYSAPEVMMVQLGDLQGKALTASRNKSLLARLSFEPGSSDFHGRLEVRNLSNEKKKLSITYFTARELQVVTSPRVLELEPNSTSSAAVTVQNFSGLLGSRYAVLAVLQWEEEGIRNSFAASQVIAIMQKDSKWKWLSVTSLSFFLLVGLLYWFVFRRPAKKDRR